MSREIKVGSKLVPALKHHVNIWYSGVKVQLHVNNLGTRWRCWPVSGSGRFTRRVKARCPMERRIFGPRTR